MQKIHAIWIAREHYDRYRAICVDQQPATWDAWEAGLNANLKRCAEQDIEVVVHTTVPDELAEWCRLRDRKVDPAGRGAYAAWRGSKSKLN